MGDLANAFDALAETLVACFSEDDIISRQMERVILQVHWKCQSYMYDQNVDLGDFCELLDREVGLMIEETGFKNRRILKNVQAKCRDLLDKLRAVVILSGFSGGEYQYSSGMSVFFPWSIVAYEVSKKNYESLWFSKDAPDKKLFWSGFLKKYLGNVAIRKLEDLTEDAAPGTKYRYRSGIRFAEPDLDGDSEGFENGSEESKLAGSKDSKLAGSKDSKLAGSKDSKLAGSKDSKLAGSKDSKLAGSKDSKLAGSKDSKLAGSKDSKLAGSKDSKLAGSKDSKLAGSKDSKLAGSKDSKLAGSKDSKLAGSGGTDQFFDALRLFKNIESPWNISGFTKRSND